MAEPSPEDRRRFPRLNTGPEYGARAVFLEQVLSHAQPKNISGCGCALQLLVEEVPSLEVGSVLDALYLDHPDLPFVPLPAVVMWVLGRHAAKTSGPITVGLDFRPVTALVQELINGHVLSVHAD